MWCSVLGGKKKYSSKTVINFTLEKPKGRCFFGTLKGQELKSHHC